jgi:hypothetical protein
MGGCEWTRGVRLLLMRKVDVKAKANYRRTALYWAAKDGHEAVVRLPLEHSPAPLLRAPLFLFAAKYSAVPPLLSSVLPWAAANGHEGCGCY